MKALQTVAVMAALAVVRCNSAASPSRTKHSNARQVNQDSQLPAAPTLVPAASAKRSSFTKRYGELAKTYAASSEAANLVEPVSVKASAGVRYVADATAAQGIPASNAVPEPPAAATGYGGGGGGGGHGHGGYFQYARVPGYDTYEFGYRKGNPYHFQERHETRHGPHFRTKQRWGDKHGGYGEHYWEYNHVPKYHH